MCGVAVKRGGVGRLVGRARGEEGGPRRRMCYEGFEPLDEINREQNSTTMTKLAKAVASTFEKAHPLEAICGVSGGRHPPLLLYGQ